MADLSGPIPNIPHPSKPKERRNGIVALSGGLRKSSTNTALLRVAQQHAPEGVEIEFYDGVGSLPFFDTDLEGEPPGSIVELREKIATADGVLIATPEYSYSIPGALRNALDWASRPNGQSVLTAKPVALMGASASTFGTVRAQNHLRDVLHSVDSKVVTKPRSGFTWRYVKDVRRR